MNVCRIDDCDNPARARGLCSKHYQAAWKRDDLPEIERGIRHVCPPDHRHDRSTTCYRQHGCRCDRCRERRSADDRLRTRQKAYGTYDPGWMDAEQVRAHVLALGEAGIGRRRLAELAGVAPSAVGALRTGRRGLPVRRVSRAVGEAILAVPVLAEPAGGAAVTALGTHRRLQALIARGWSESRLSRELGLSANNMRAWFSRDRVTRARADAVAVLYERLWDKAPPMATPAQRAAATRSMNFARRNGWVPPLAWDDIDLDDAPAAPCSPTKGDGIVDDVAVLLAVSGERPDLTPAERRETVVRLHRMRWSDPRIADTLGCDKRTVLRIRQELGLGAHHQDDLEDRFSA